MQPEECLRQGNLDEALVGLKDQVRKEPANAKHRVFLFQLQAVLGDWNRAMTQLNVAGELDPGTLAMVQTYREALRCEVLRGQIFAGQRSPLVFGEPEQWVALVMQALVLGASGKHAEAAQVREQAFEAAPETPGAVDDQPFAWIADADSRLGPLLEAIVNGRYYWIPYQRIRVVRLEKPCDLRDLAWTPAQFTWANGGETVGLIPTRYPGSEASDDPGVRMARKTEWLEQSPGSFVGLGQRMLTTDAGDYSLMDVRQITLHAAEGGDD